MANIKSAQKRIEVNNKKKARNVSAKSELRTSVKKVKTLAAENKKKEAQAELNNAFSQIDRAASSNIIHKNNAANKKAQLAKIVDNIK